MIASRCCRSHRIWAVAKGCTRLGLHRSIIWSVESSQSWTTRHRFSTSRRSHSDGSYGNWRDSPLPIHSSESTIFALSSGADRAGIAIIRISGHNSQDVYRSLCPDARPLKPRYACVRTIYEPHVAPSPETTLDTDALVLYFPAPRSATGEDVLELHVHGGPAIVKAVLSAIPRCSRKAGSIRPAEPGEFTRRAFMNDRLDLVQVEALSDTLTAQTEVQRRVAIRGATAQLGRRYEDWRNQLLSARGELEALIDFSEDQHFDASPSELMSGVSTQVNVLLSTLSDHVQSAVRAELLRGGVAISLLGAPNAGKSSLLNRIAGREAAIVSPEPGTTRDVVEVALDISGYLCRFADTAGLREARDVSAIEREGIRRALAAADTADLVVVVLSFSPDGMIPIDPAIAEAATNLLSDGRAVLVLANKSDLLPSDKARLDAVKSIREAIPAADKVAFISTLPVPNDGIQSFLSSLTEECNQLTASEGGEAAIATSSRHRSLLEECASHLSDYLALVSTDEGDGEADVVLAAEHLRLAAGCLARVTGRGEDAGDVEEVLGVVFEKFCVGK